MSFSRRGRTRVFGIFALVLALSFSWYSNASAAGAGAITLSPSSGQHEVGATFTVAVKMNTGGVAVNAAEGSLVFDAKTLQVVSLSKTGSVFTLWTTEPTFSNTAGTIAFGGGLPNPGYTGTSGQLITITFRGTSATTVKGYTDVVLVSGALLANDGSGTNILQTLGRATFFIAPKGIAPTPIPGQVSGLAPAITSSTHPDSAKWYANENPLFSWSLPAGVTEVRLAVGPSAATAPHVRYTPPISQKALDTVGDGTQYFNVQFVTSQGVGPVGTFRFNVDTHPPAAFFVTRVDTADATEPQPQVVFSTTDAMSGVDHYEIRLDTGAWASISPELAGKPYALAGQLPGTHHVSVKAVDRAGNGTLADTDVVVQSIPVPSITEYPQQVNTGSSFTISGHGILGTNVLLYPADDTTNRIGSAPVGKDGTWHTGPLSLSSGVHPIVAYSQDSRGAVSNPSNAVTIVAGLAILGWVMHFGTLLLTGIRHPGTAWFLISLLFYGILVSLFVDLIMHWLGATLRRRKERARAVPVSPKKALQKSEALIPMLAAVVAYWWKSARQRRQIRRDANALRKHERYSEKKMDALIANMNEELALLKKIRSHRPLDPKEAHLRSILVQSHKALARKK